ncbi:hypothetical protein H4R21_004760, partial [Coemansia helicoidea]
MHSGAAIAEASLRRQGKTLAEVVSGDPRTLCSGALEAAAAEIRGSSGWLQRIIQGRRTAQKQQQGGGEAAPAEAADSVLRPSDSCLVVQCGGLCDDASDKALDMVPLVDRFGSCGSQWPDSGSQAPAAQLPARARHARWLRVAALVLVQAGLAAYLCALCRLLGPRADSPFAWHPVLMSAALAAATEGVVAVQHSGGGRRHRALHYGAHAAAGLALAGGAVACGRRRDGPAEHAPAHAAVGVLALVL